MRKKVLLIVATWTLMAFLIREACAEEDENWYEAYQALLVDWELEGYRLETEPRPSPRQTKLAERARAANDSISNITDLDRHEREFYRSAQDEGLPMLRRLANFSKSLEDVSVFSHRSSSRVVRYYERMVADDTFAKGIKHLGVLF